MDGRWQQNVLALKGLLEKMSVRDASGKDMPHDEGFEKWSRMAGEVRAHEGTIFFIGNGASASMASHFAADVGKNLRLRTMVFTDPALITALANDLGYEHVYAVPLQWHMRKGDMLIAISSSGNSGNIVRAVREARLQGGYVITLSAMGEENSIRKLGDLNFYISAVTYGLAETGHATILHYWTDMLFSEEGRSLGH